MFLSCNIFQKVKIFLGVSLIACLSSCDWMGKAPPPPLPGERIPVLVYDYSLKRDEDLDSHPVSIPEAEDNKDWPQAGGNPSHLMPPLALNPSFKEAWSSSIGTGSSQRNRLIVEPIIAQDHVFTMDTAYRVTCFDLQNGDSLWDVDVSAADLKGASLGGGLAYEESVLYVTTAIGEVMALDASTGAEKWRTSVIYPVRAAPTVADGKVFVLTLNNTIEALDASSGEKLWTHTGATEIAGLLGAASPAYSMGSVIAPLISGEIIALKADTGEPIWTDSLVSMRKLDGLTGLAHIRARPIIDENVVYAISHSGRMVALNLDTGDRIWDKDIGGLYAPFIAGDFLFVLNLDGELLCLLKSTGQIKWVQDLTTLLRQEQKSDSSEESEDTSSKKEEIHWVGPLVAGGDIIVVGSNATLLKLSPQTGEIKETLSLKEKVLLPPIVAQKTLFLLTDDGYIIAYR